MDLTTVKPGKEKELSFADKVFNNFHSIYFFVMVVAIVIYSFYASSNLKNEPLTVMSITTNLLLLIVLIAFNTYFWKLISSGGNSTSGPIAPVASSDNIPETNSGGYQTYSGPPLNNMTSASPLNGKEFVSSIQNMTPGASLDKSIFTTPIQNMSENNPISMLSKAPMEAINKADGKNMFERFGIMKPIPEYGI
jgi:hypothetical protein